MAASRSAGISWGTWFTSRSKKIWACAVDNRGLELGILEGLPSRRLLHGLGHRRHLNVMFRLPELVAILMTQFMPSSYYPIRSQFDAATYQAFAS